MDAQIANLDGAKIDDATITTAKINDLHGSKITANTITADKMSVTELSAIAANCGTITTGLIKSSDGKIQYDLGNKWIKIWDAQATPVLRVHLGYIP